MDKTGISTKTFRPCFRIVNGLQTLKELMYMLHFIQALHYVMEKYFYLFFNSPLLKS
jgi:hypothetical protein